MTIPLHQLGDEVRRLVEAGEVPAGFAVLRHAASPELRRSHEVRLSILPAPDLGRERGPRDAFPGAEHPVRGSQSEDLVLWCEPLSRQEVEAQGPRPPGDLLELHDEEVAAFGERLSGVGDQRFDPFGRTIPLDPEQEEGPRLGRAGELRADLENATVDQVGGVEDLRR